MQILVVFLAVPVLGAFAALTPRDIVQFVAVRQKCGNEFAVDPGTIGRVRAGAPIEDPEFDCFMACLLEGMNLMTNGRLNVDSALQKLPDTGSQDELAQAIRTCANQRGGNKCETAHRLYACMRERGVPNMLSGR